MNDEYLFLFEFYKYEKCRLNTKRVSIEEKDIERGFYDNSKIQYEVPIIDEKWNGKLNAWDDDGNLRVDTNFINGIEDGVHRNFYYNGRIKEEIIFKDGKKNGKSRGWNRNGKQWYEVDYKDDLRHGISRAYSPQGKLEIEKEFMNNYVHGLLRQWDKKGNETIQFYWENREITKFNAEHAQIVSAFLEKLGYKIEAPSTNKKVGVNNRL